jgi:CDP-glycerol glycerophosphotransferase
MPAQPVLSIIIPVYGVEEYVAACLDSIMRQAPANTEVIAVDDASPDGCGRILDARAQEDPRLRVLHLADNAGPGNARNLGLAQAAGEYVWFVDADDLLADGGLAAIAARLEQDHPDVLLIGYENLYPGGGTGPGPGLALLRAAPARPFTLAEQPKLIELTMTSWSKVIRRAFLTGLGVAFAGGIHEDVPVSCVMLLRAERISALSRACYRYRQARPGSLLATVSSAQLRIFCSYERVFALVADADPALAGELREALFQRAIWHYTTILPLVPRAARRAYFRRMHEDFARYRPVRYRHPPGVRRVKFWLVERNAYMIYTVVEPVNQLRVLLARAAAVLPGRPAARIKWAAGSRSLRS